jgi:FK506-binding protein 2
VPKPESIVTKSATAASEEASETASGVGEKIAEKIAEAADAAKTVVADSDDSQEHNEL